MQSVRRPNRLLAALPLKDYQRVVERCQPVQLTFADVLCESGDRIEYVYFVGRGLVSLLTPVDSRLHIEVGIVGREGMAGIPLMLGATFSPVRMLVQGAGTALRMPAASFRSEIKRSPALQRQLNRYLCTLMVQVAQTAACNSLHLVGPRLARWLLMTQDRVESNEFYLTQEFLVPMLGVQRAGINKAAHSLQRQKLIRYSRGNITIINRRGLERASCSCYQAVIDRTAA
ncbi:MAG: Crp/Fnr family transcriptional regulator [Gammaproteobacteria bacterium]|nr:Crp/Fnr family transcriptional regulator [Gammaproteobacteria bacterium]